MRLKEAQRRGITEGGRPVVGWQGSREFERACTMQVDVPIATQRES